ncbi:MAG: prevent-host-death protein [Chloroflexi bacterium]|nr:prevent-host-death protein [Chloroflexota bacterium]
MIPYSMQEAQNRLEQLMDDAQRGKTVVIVDEQNRMVQLVPIAAPTQPRRAGSARGKVVLAPDFDAPLD